jgi:hypothetical protein
MKTILGSRRDHYLVKVCIFLITAALIAAMTGCVLTQYDLTISSTEGGEVTTPREGMFTYDEGTIVDLVADADDGYRFVKWTGNVSAIADVNADATTITMHDSYSIIANFEELDPGTLFAGGNETEENPYQIANWHHLYNIRDYLNSHFILINDLYSTTAGYEELASPTAKEGKGWQPIGSWDARFTGSFDGRGYEIRNLFINRSDEDDVGLFSAVEQSGVIKNIGVTNATVIGQDRVGGLVGYNSGGIVSNSYSTGSVTGTIYHVGGLVGGNEGTVSNSYSSGSVTGDKYVGGLVGTNIGTVSNSYSTGSVTGNDDLLGGLVGVNEGTVTNSYSTGNVTGNLGVGGLVGVNGYTGPGIVSNSYSTGSVNGESYVGGLVGGNSPESNVSNSYSTGSVAGSLSAGGLVGGNEGGTVTDSYSVGSVTGNSDVGGLVGWNKEGTVSSSYSTGDVTGDERVGGLLGSNEWGTVTNSYSVGSVRGNSSVGGLVGDNGGIVSNSYSTGSVSGNSAVGGLAGLNWGDVSDSYSTGSVSGNSAVGGLVGWNEGTVSNSYSIGSVTGGELVGGLVGNNFVGFVTNSFWDIETSGQSTSAGGTGKTTAEMQDIATFSGAAWNIVAIGSSSERNPAYIWNIANGVTYPFLSWQD